MDPPCSSLLESVRKLLPLELRVMIYDRVFFVDTTHLENLLEEREWVRRHSLPPAKHILNSEDPTLTGLFPSPHARAEFLKALDDTTESPGRLRAIAERMAPTIGVMLDNCSIWRLIRHLQRTFNENSKYSPQILQDLTSLVACLITRGLLPEGAVLRGKRMRAVMYQRQDILYDALRDQCLNVGNDFLLSKLLCENIGPGFLNAIEQVQITYDPTEPFLCPTIFPWSSLTSLQLLTVILQPMARECDPRSIAHAQILERQSDDPGWIEGVELFLHFVKDINTHIVAWASPSGATILRRIGGWESTDTPEFFVRKKSADTTSRLNNMRLAEAY